MNTTVKVAREDVRKLNKEYYSLKDKEINVYPIPQMQYLIASGIGERNIFRMYDYDGIWTIGRFINRVKYYTKRELGKNFSRMPIEVEWGKEVEGEAEFMSMMWVPDYISEEFFEITMNDLANRLDKFDSNLSLAHVPQRNCAQLLHTGKYDHIDSTKQSLLEELNDKGYSFTGRPQEIFMNHPHCNPPHKLNILLRQEIIF